MGAAVKTHQEASALLEAFCRQPGGSLAAAEHGGWEVFRQLLREVNLPARLCTDALLAALAIANGWRLARRQLRRRVALIGGNPCCRLFLPIALAPLGDQLKGQV